MNRTLVAGVLGAVVLAGCGETTPSGATTSTGGYGTWAWDGTKWSQLAANTPGGFTSQISDGVTAHGSLVYWKDFGGLIATNATKWEATKWTGASWVADDALPKPPPDEHSNLSSLGENDNPLILDEANNQLLHINPNIQTIWAWSRGTWLSVLSPRQWPKQWPKGQAVWHVGYDPYRQEVLILQAGLLASSDDSSTWAWNGTALVKLSPIPYAGNVCSVMPDGANHLLAFCWWGAFSWDGKDWSRLASVTDDCPKSSVDIAEVQMAYDRAHKQLIALGSDTQGGFQMWLWQQGNWKSMPTASSPPSSGFVSNLVYDPALPGLVLTVVPQPDWVPPVFIHCPHT